MKKNVALTAVAAVSFAVVGCTSPPPANNRPTQEARSPAPSRDRATMDGRSSGGYRRALPNDQGYRDDRGYQDREASRAGRSGRHQQQAQTGTPGSFDFYLLNLSWSPEFCATHPQKPECAQRLGFILHGLWPQNNNGSYPEACSNTPGPVDPTAFRDLYPDPGLLQHEWQTHGTCSGLSPDAFFNLARKAVHSVAIPREIVSLNHATSMPPAAILDLFTAANAGLPGSSLALSCGNNYLTAVEVCMDKSLHPIACQQVRSCRANSVRIPPPNP